MDCFVSSPLVIISVWKGWVMQPTVNGPREVGSVILLTPHLKNGRLVDAVVVLRYIDMLHSVLSIPLIHVVAVLSKSVGVWCKRCLLYL